jgi:hypothetical protein
MGEWYESNVIKYDLRARHIMGLRMCGLEKTHVVDLVKGNVSSVLDVLLLLSVPWGFWTSVHVVAVI